MERDEGWEEELEEDSEGGTNGRRLAGRREAESGKEGGREVQWYSMHHPIVSNLYG